MYNRLISKKRWVVERTFGGMRRWFGCGMTRYVGLAKTHIQHFFAKVSLYPLIGLRVSGVKVSVLDISESVAFFGMNFGAGFDVKLFKTVFFNVESKYMLSFRNERALHGFTTSAGLIFRF